jgi:hypothetical protein
MSTLRDCLDLVVSVIFDDDDDEHDLDPIGLFIRNERQRWRTLLDLIHADTNVAFDSLEDSENAPSLRSMQLVKIRISCSL